VAAQHPVLFFPGTLCDERIFLPLWKSLSIAQRRYVPLQWAATKDDMLALSKDRVLPNEKVHLVGYSMGGYIAALFASMVPQQVASITLIGYSPLGLSTDEITKRKQLVTMLKKGQFKTDNPAYLSRFVHPSRMNDESVIGVVKAMANDLGKNTLLNHTQATTPRENTTAVLAKINAPVTFIAAQQDNIAPLNDIQRAAKQIPCATLHEFENTGHMIPLEQTAQLATIIDKQVSD
jgi:pimeloyl-ACP methyl ester carboxylesterase